MIALFRRLVTVTVLIACLVSVPLAVAQQGDTPVGVQVNYTEVTEGNGKQAITVYFTLEDAAGRAVRNVGNLKAELLLGTQPFPGLVSVPTTPLYISLVLDASGSMRASARDMRNAAIAAVNSAPPNTFFQVIQFNSAVRVVVPFTDDKQQVVNAIGAIRDNEFTGGTCLYDATFDAIIALQNAAATTTGRRAAVVFTDGVDEIRQGGPPCSTRADINKVTQSAREGQFRVPIYAIGLGRVNRNELELIATNTGGRAVIAPQASQLSAVFQEVIDTLASQRQATFDVCAAAGTYSGILIIASQQGASVNLNAPVVGLNLNTTCLVPTIEPSATVTSTLIPLTLEVGEINFDSAKNAVTFKIKRRGQVVVARYRVEIIDKTTGIQIPGDYGNFVIPNETDDQLVIVPVQGIAAPIWQIRVTPLDRNNRELDGSIRGIEIQPPRTATPSPTATSTETPTATPTVTLTPTPTATQTPEPTATPTLAAVINDIGFDQAEQTFIVDLSLFSFTLGNVKSYEVLVQDANKLTKYKQEFGGAPPNPLRVKAVDDTGKDLPEGKYAISVTLNKDGLDKGIVTQAQEVTRPAPPVVVEPSAIDNLVEAVRKNPVLAAGLVVVAIAILLFAFTRTRRKPGFDDSRIKPAKPPKTPPPARGKERASGASRTPQPPAPEELTGGHTIAEKPGDAIPADKGGILKLTASTNDQVGKEWRISSRIMPFRIGRGGNADFPVQLTLGDPGVSSLHATIQFDKGHYWLIDEGSTNGTYVNGEKLRPAQRHLLDTGHEIQFGQLTRFEFTDLNKQEPTGKTDQVKLKPEPPTALGPTSPVADKPTGSADRPSAPPATPPVMQDMDDAATSVNLAPNKVGLPQGVVAKFDVVKGAPNVAAGKTVEVLTTEFSIGRKRANDLAFESMAVSRVHVILTYENSKFKLTDQDSTYGTFVDGTALPKRGSVVLESNRNYTIGLGDQKREGVVLNFKYVSILTPPAFEDEATNVGL